jgi:hypothetical protein
MSTKKIIFLLLPSLFWMGQLFAEEITSDITDEDLNIAGYTKQSSVDSLKESAENTLTMDDENKNDANKMESFKDLTDLSADATDPKSSSSKKIGLD